MAVFGFWPPKIIGTIWKVLAQPGTFQYGATVALDGKHNDYQMSDVVSGALAMTLGTVPDGTQGTIYVKQDGTGHAVTVTAVGRTVKQAQAIPTTADANLAIGYEATTVAGVPLLWLFPNEEM
ncbi:MAG: hypothetical protein ACOYD1_12780 [Candidatus Nanopelagicales bacterium]